MRKPAQMAEEEPKPETWWMLVLYAEGGQRWRMTTFLADVDPDKVPNAHWEAQPGPMRLTRAEAEAICVKVRRSYIEVRPYGGDYTAVTIEPFDDSQDWL